VTKSSPLGSVDSPFNPVSLALGAEATFVARAMESDRAELTTILRAAAEHRGTALVEIYQNCPIFNDGAFEVLKDRSQQEARIVRLRAGESVTVGSEDDRKVLVRKGSGTMKFIPEAEAASGESGAVVVHDPALDDPSQAFQLSRLDSPEMTHVPMGIFRSVERPTYDDLVRAQVDSAVDTAGGPATDEDLGDLLRGRDTWTVE
jgi:2-oxoglutarate ferredoxin oxidoreductase subunit beta